MDNYAIEKKLRREIQKFVNSLEDAFDKEDFYLISKDIESISTAVSIALKETYIKKIAVGDVK